MMTLRSSGLACVLTLALSACGDSDSSPLTALADAPEASSASEAAAPAPSSTEAGPSDSEARAEAPSDAALPSDSAAPAADAGPPAELRWRSCGTFQNRNLECAEVEVPIDYDQPAGDKLPIALRRVLADPREPYRGSLLYNPGGPGGAGIDSALALVELGLFDVIAPGYDIIGFDPRGVAASGEVGCGIATDNLYPGAEQTETETPSFGIEDYLGLYAAEGERCEREWGPLFRKLGSNNVVRDLEEIRKALDEPVLNFFGIAYGTRLAALYAHEYPETTGRMVLDAAVSPRFSRVEAARDQFYAAVELHERLLSDCENGVLECPEEPRLLFDQAVANASARGLEVDFVIAWLSLLARFDAPTLLVQALAAEEADPGGEWILDFMAGGGEGGVGLVPLISVNCTDDNFEPPTPAEIESLRAEFEAVGSVFAEDALLNAAICAAWPATRDPVPLPTAMDAPPLLVIGGTADARAPYEWSFAMAEALGNATLLTSNHFGHGAVSAPSNDCVRFFVRAYLTSGSMPPTGAQCP